ncbi:MAG: VgrG-related protein [Elainellaceae cyanobacterium]
MADGNYRALPAIKIDGQEPPVEFMEDILQLFVEESLRQPGMFTLIIRNDYQPGRDGDRPWKYQDIIQIGKAIKIGFVSSTATSEDFKEEIKGQVLEGEITAIEAHFTERTQAPIIIRGYDVSHRLHRGVYNRSFQNMTDSDVVKKIADEAGIPLGTVDASGEPHEYLFQENQTNMEFLRDRAARIGFELFVKDGKLNFRKPSAGEILELAWLQDIHSFRVRTTSAEQVKEVEVRGWDYTQKRAIVSTAKSEKVLTETDQSSQQKGSEVSTAFNGKPTNPRMVVVNPFLVSPSEADRMAQAICNELGGQYVHADAKGEGSPNIRPGIRVRLEEMGPYTGDYYVTETRHIYTERLYETEFSIRGLRSGNLLSTLVPPTAPRPGQTPLIGIVTDNEDPDGMGRVKVKFPTLTEDHASNWARVVSVGAADGRGLDCLPEIDDEVLVAFEHGDIHRPYVLGGVWNGEDAPPNSTSDNVQNGQVRLRTFRTRTGHQLQFVEEDNGSKAGAYLETTGGHRLRLNDSEQFMELETSGGHRIKLTDAGRAIEVQTAGGHHLKLVDSSGSISLKSIGSLKIEATGNIDIKAGGVITVQGALIKLN